MSQRHTVSWKKAKTVLSAACKSMPRSARFSRVAYNVDSARVEQRTDLDKLIIDLRDQRYNRPGRGYS